MWRERLNLPCIGEPGRKVDCDRAAVEWSIGERHDVDSVCEVCL